ncbi:MAG: NAD(P)-dependent oxidoreductase [Chloroflexota bacterium]
MAHVIAPRTTRFRTAVFPDERSLEAAVHSLTGDGYPLEWLGVAIRDHAHLLTAMSSPGREYELDHRLLEAGATSAGATSELPGQYGPAPHPGVREDHDLKLPMGREFPASTWAPAVAGYRIRPPVLDPRHRVWSFDEVEPGYSLADALVEADRCLRCPEPRCVDGCPAHNAIPDFIAALRAEDFHGAAETLRHTTDFPDICGRVCDKARQCEGACILGEEGGDPVAIGLLERFVADWEIQSGLRAERASRRAPASGRRVAIVGSGPSGLAVAEELALRGHGVVVFDALPMIGGALAWGIPTFRLPQPVLGAEVDFLRALDVAFRLNTHVGTDPTVEQLFAEGFDAVFLGAGATVSTSPGIPGEHLEGVYSSTEFLSRAKLARVAQAGQWTSPIVGERLAVIGAGNTAMDVAQTAVRLSRAELRELSAKQTTMDVAETAMRLGFREVTVIYRRSEAEMPARHEEIESAREEGVRFRFLTAPLRFLGQGGHVQAMECVEMALAEPDSRGRPAPVPKPGTELILEVDTVVLALGYQIDRGLMRSLPGLEADASGAVVIDERTGRTSRAGLWAGGDVVHGPDTVVRAMVAGRRAALDIHRHLDSRHPSGKVSS